MLPCGSRGPAGMTSTREMGIICTTVLWSITLFCHRHHACAPKASRLGNTHMIACHTGVSKRRNEISLSYCEANSREKTPNNPRRGRHRPLPLFGAVLCTIRYDTVYLFPPTSAHFNYTPVCSRLRTDPLPREISLEQGADEACLAHAVLPDNEYHGFGLEIRRIHGRRVEVGVAAGLLEG